MTKAQQKAFNDALIAVAKSKERKLVADLKNKRYVVMIPLSTVISSFGQFVKKVNKEVNKISGKKLAAAQNKIIKKNFKKVP